MNVLLDTQALVWHYLDAPQLSALARATILDPANWIFVSPISPWEIAIKVCNGKYSLHVPFQAFVREAIHDPGFRILPIESQHSAELTTLSYHHRDPFDRMLVAQAMVENMPIVSSDAMLDAYPIRRIW